MLKENAILIQRLHVLMDMLLTAAAFVAAYFIKRDLLPQPFQGLTTVPNYYIVLLLIVIIWYIVFAAYGLHGSLPELKWARAFWDSFKTVATGMLLLTLAMFLFKITDVSRIMLGLFFLLNILFLMLNRIFVFRLITAVRQSKHNLRNILIVGSRDGAREIIEAIGDPASTGYRIVGCLEVEGRLVGRQVAKEVHVIDTLANLETVLRTQAIDELVFSMSLDGIDGVVKKVALAEDMGVAVRMLPSWSIRHLGYQPTVGRLELEQFAGLPTLVLTSAPFPGGQLLLKAVIDYVLAAVAVVLALPLFALVAVGIKSVSKGPVLFSQERYGLQGRRFRMYKFRTMVWGAEERGCELETLNEADGPVFKMKDDPRIIPYLGKFLRKTGIDELPQLVNVIKGEMSLVGPRPPIPSEVDKYDIWQRRRLSMKPGLTCLWQITPGRNRVGFDDWMKMDLAYIDNWSLWLDAKILFRTVKAVFTGAGQ